MDLPMLKKQMAPIWYDEDNFQKISKNLKYINGTIQMPMTFTAIESNIVKPIEMVMR